MKPIQKGLAIIASATLLTVLAISFLGDGSKDKKQSDDVVAATDGKATQANDTKGLGTEGGAINAQSASADGKGEVEVVTEAESTPSVANLAEEPSEGVVSNESSETQEATASSQTNAISNHASSSLTDTPAPPGPFHKNTLAGSQEPQMPAAPTAPMSDNTDLPPPPMPQALIDTPQTPEALGKTISKPEFVVTKPEMDLSAPNAPAPAANVVTTGGTVETVKAPEIQSDNTSASTVSTADQQIEGTTAGMVAEATDSAANAAVNSPEQPSEPEIPEGIQKQHAETAVAPVAGVTETAQVNNTSARMPEQPSAPEVPAKIQQSGVNVQNQPMNQQPRVIFVPVPVYPYQQQGMSQQQWGVQAPQMNFVPPQPPVMGESAPTQGQE